MPIPTILPIGSGKHATTCRKPKRRPVPTTANPTEQIIYIGDEDNSMVHVLTAGDLVGDLDGDGDVNLEDFAIFADCLAGPEVNTPPPACTQQQFDSPDLDRDNDVDLSDFGGFQVTSCG